MNEKADMDIRCHTNVINLNGLFVFRVCHRIIMSDSPILSDNGKIIKKYLPYKQVI